MRLAFLFACLAALCLLVACGGGGGGGGGGSGPAGPGNQVSGSVLKGAFSSGTVTAFAITAAGAAGATLGTGAISATGTYSLDVGSHTGPLLLRATSGTFRDEVTGSTAQTAALAAVLPATSGSNTCMITPLTSLAAALALRQIGLGGAASSATALANQRVAGYYGIASITATVPVDLGAGPASAGASATQGALLAGISQQAFALGVASDVLTQALAQDMADGVFDGLDGATPIVVGAGNLPPTTGFTAMGTAIGTFLASGANTSTLTSADFTALLTRLGALGGQTLFIDQIALSPGSLTVAMNMQVQYSAIATFTDGTVQDVTSTASWQSSDTNVATVSSTGLATAGTTAGPANITATQVATGLSVLTTGNFTLTSITVTPATPSLALDQQQQFVATANYSNATTADISTLVNWQSSASGTLAMSATGRGTGMAEGTANATATEPGTGIAGSTTVTVFTSYAANIQPIFNASCTNCHSGTGASGGLRLNGYANLMAGGMSGAVVLAGNPNSSILILRLEGTSLGTRMPQNAAPLPQSTINRIRDWITAGANNN